MSGITGGGEVVGGGLPRISHGKGIHLWDQAGKRYVDASGGPAVFSLGHGDPRVNAAIIAQLERVAHGYRYLFSSDPLEALTAIIAEECGGDLQSMVFVCDGSEAVEACLKLTLQYHWARAEPQRVRFIARERSYHGNTLMATGLSGFAERTAPFAAALPPVIRVSAANAYRPPSGADLVPFLMNELETAILAAGPETIAAFIFEPVVGAAGGVVPAPPGYAAGVRALCDRYGILMIADEVMCGAGRTGTWRALGFDGVEPDLMAVAKSLSGGYLPLGAAIYSTHIAKTLAAAGGPLTGHTYTGHTACLAAALAVQEIIREEALLDRVATRGASWQASLRDRFTRFAEIGDVRGRGYFIGLELVRDPVTKTPFPAAARLHLRIRAVALAHGLICYPCGGNLGDGTGDTIILAPPFNATDGDLEEITDLLEATLDAVLGDLGKSGEFA
jgi:adenosylmethionine-8-amino-7-oxononanoate aminotransferase